MDWTAAQKGPFSHHRLLFYHVTVKIKEGILTLFCTNAVLFSHNFHRARTICRVLLSESVTSFKSLLKTHFIEQLLSDLVFLCRTLVPLI